MSPMPLRQKKIGDKSYAKNLFCVPLINFYHTKNVCFVGMEIFCPVYHFFMAISITIIPSQDAREELEIKYWPVYPIDPFFIGQGYTSKESRK